MVDVKEFDLGDKILLALSTEDKLKRAIIGWPSESDIPGVVVGLIQVVHPEPKPHTHWIYLIADAAGVTTEALGPQLRLTDNWEEVKMIAENQFPLLLKNLETIARACREAKNE